MSREILFKEDARTKLRDGADKVANAVKVTLGCSGRNVVISKFKGNTPIVTKDGYSVAKDVYLKDELENVGAELMKGVSLKTVNDAGDGTTTATVLAQFLINEGLKMVSAGSNPIDLKRGMDKAVSLVVSNIKSSSIKVNGNADMIKNIATISANNDSELGALISDAFSRIGDDGIITVEDSYDGETKINVVEGMRIDRGYINQHFVTNPDKMEAVLDNPVIIVTDAEITSLKEITPILEKIVPTGKSILLVCGDISQEALAFITLNKVKGALKIAAMKPQSAYRNESFADIATMTGAFFISDTAGYKIENATMDMLGSADKVVLNQLSTTIIGGKGDLKELDTRKVEIKSQLEEATVPFDVDRLKKRLARISGGIAIMYVGAASEVEMNEKKDRVDDAIRATKSAIEEGIVAGGGICLINCISELKTLKSDNTDEVMGINIVLKSLEAPLKQILLNCGISDSLIINKIKNKEERGYNAKTEKFEDLILAGVIDPAKVVRCALENACSVAGMIITIECSLTEIEEKQ